MPDAVTSGSKTGPRARARVYILGSYRLFQDLLFVF